MAAEMDQGLLSDTEGGEKPVREQLQKANIQDPNAPRTDAHSQAGGSNGEPAGRHLDAKRGGIQRKRSFEEVEAEPQGTVTAEVPAKQHTRKRSRDSTAEGEVANNGKRKTSGERSRDGGEMEENMSEANGTAQAPRESTPEKTHDTGLETLASPKTKRSRLHSTADDDTALSDGDPLPTSNAIAEKTAASTIESKTDAPDATTKIPPGSAFSNTSTASPFGALAGSKSPSAEHQTPPSAFASSGFGALAGSSASGFGALGKTSGGPGLGGGFASGDGSALKDKGQLSTFASGPAASGGFGSSASGFGKLGGASSGGFGGGLGGTGFSSLGGGGGLSSFASGKPDIPLGGSSKPARAFGSPALEEDADDGGDEGDDKSGMRSPLAQEEDKQDERFYEQEIETGEEGEITEMTCRAKIYNWAAVEDGKKEWRERGVGVLRLNVTRPSAEDEDSQPKARLLMRADGSHRVLLNTPVRREIQFGTPTGDKPTGGYIFFSGTIDNKTELQLLQLKVRRGWKCCVLRNG
jgi:Ran-binding protein 3